jgi:RsiW-degrading membrane proteinase PrsW (M82 family)
MLLSLTLSLAIPLLIVYILWLFDLYALNRMRMVILALIWGGIAFGISLFLQSVLVRAGWINYIQLVQWIAPAIEEILKGLFILLLVWHARVHSVSEGLTYGFASGIGFGITENIFYVVTNPTQPLTVATARIVSSTLMHAVASGLLGAAVSRTSVQIDMRRRQFTQGLLTAVGLHLIYNHLALAISGLYLILVGMTIGIGGLWIIWQHIHVDLREQARQIRQYFQSHLPTGEVDALLNPDMVIEKLKSQSGIFSSSTIHILEEYVRLMARRAMLERYQLPTEAGHHSARFQLQLDQIDQSLQKLHQEMGIYARLWLRSVLPSSESELWMALGTETKLDTTTHDLLQRLSINEAIISHEELRGRIALLQNCTLFSKLAWPDLRDLGLLMEHNRFEVGDLILTASLQYDNLYLVKSGVTVATIATQHQGNIVVSTYTAGDCFNEHGLITGITGSEQVEAVSKGELYRLRRDDFVSLVYGRPHIGINMIQGLVGQVQQRTALIQWVQDTATTPLSMAS